MLKTFSCPSCDAALDVPEAVSTKSVRCPYCGTTVIVPDTLRQSEEAAQVHVHIPAGTARRSGGGCVTIFVLLLLVGIGLGVFLVIPTGRSTEDILSRVESGIANVESELSSINIHLTGPELLLSVGDGMADDVILTSHDLSGDLIYLHYIDGANGGERWQSQPFDESSGSVNLFADGGRVYYAHQEAVTALERESGQTVWQATLSDQVAYNCPTCLLSFGEVVVVMSVDGSLQALNTATGERLWQETLNVTLAQSMYHLGDYVGIMTRDDALGVGLDLFDPNSGERIKRINARCPHPAFDDQEPNVTDSLLVDDTKQRLYFVFGFFDPTCIQSWDYGTGERVWNSFLDVGGALPRESLLLQDEQSIYFATDQEQLYRADKESGEVQLLADSETHTLLPLGVKGNVLLIQAVRTQGTRRDELWAVATDGRGVLWRQVPQADEIMNLASSEVLHDKDDGFWTAQVTTRGVHLVQARHEPARLVVETLSLNDGASSGQVDVPFGLSDSSVYWFSLIGWQDDGTLWVEVNLDGIWAVDVETAVVTQRWP